MNRNYLKYIWIAGVSILGLTGCDDYLNRESTSGVNTPDLIWQNPKAITAVLADMYDSGLKLDEFDDWYGSKKANLANQTSLSDEATLISLCGIIRKRVHLINQILLILMAIMYLMTIW